MVQIEVNGMQLECDKEFFNDIEVADMLYDLTSGEQIPPLKKLLVATFGKSQYKKIINSLKDEDGRVRMTDAADFFAAAMDALSAKN